MKKTILLLAALITTAIGSMAQTDPLAGKRIGVIGDSYVKNHQNPVEYAWHSKLAKKHGMKYYNYGRNGSCVSIDMKTWGPAVVNRYQQMNDSLDVVVVIAGGTPCQRRDRLNDHAQQLSGAMRQAMQGTHREIPSGLHLLVYAMGKRQPQLQGYRGCHQGYLRKHGHSGVRRLPKQQYLCA